MAQTDQPIFMVRPRLPEIQDYMDNATRIWDRAHITNFGPEERALQSELKAHEGVDNLFLFSSGHLSLEAALAALPEKGEVILPSFTFASTAQAVLNQHHTPVFVDIGDDMTLDPTCVAEAITERTVAILGVHVYGIPCALAELQTIADANDVALIFDGAHSFGVKVDGRSIATYGDATMYSFHATKIFHTVEGGGLALGSDRLRPKTIETTRNFGIDDSSGQIVTPGTNSKLSEFHALVGRLLLPDFQAELDARARVAEMFRERLEGHSAIRTLEKGMSRNNSYFPTFIEGFGERSETVRDGVLSGMQEKSVFARAYFSPALHRAEPFVDFRPEKRLSKTDNVVSRVVCLPIHGRLSDDEVDRICDSMRTSCDRMHNRPG